MRYLLAFLCVIGGMVSAFYTLVLFGAGYHWVGVGTFAIAVFFAVGAGILTED